MFKKKFISIFILYVNKLGLLPIRHIVYLCRPWPGTDRFFDAAGIYPLSQIYHCLSEALEISHFRIQSSVLTSAPIGALKCNFRSFQETMTDRPTDQQTNRPGHRKFTLSIMALPSFTSSLVWKNHINIFHLHSHD